jgi:peroxiredoxin
LAPALVLIATVCSALFAPPSHAAATIGARIDDFRLPDVQGQAHALGELADREFVVVAFLGTQCPLAKLYSVRLQALADQYAERGVAVVAVMSNVQDSLADVEAFVVEHGVKYSVLMDQGSKVADQFGAKRTPTVYLLDGERAVRYVGRVDDQYTVGRSRMAPTRDDLQAAIDELLADKPVTVATTEPLGCIIGRRKEAAADAAVTFHRDVAPILQARCVECHRAGEIGPFELTSYDEAAGWGEMLAEVVRDERMPPWHANPAHGEFANARRMPESEREVLYQWVAAGCPEGDAADAPAPREFTAGWQTPREPDVVLAMEEPFAVPADAGRSGVPYQYFVVPTGFTEDTWVEAAEVQPGNRAVVHHVIAYAAPPEVRARRRDWIFLSAYVPGLRFDALPAQSAKRVPAGYVIVFEMHYTPNGAPQQDVTKIGLLKADVAAIEHEVVTTEVGNLRFAIPPGDDNHVVTATSQPVGEDVTLLSLSPHMHLRGKAFRYELVTPAGEREVLLDVPAYDFNWQTRYVLAQPRQLPAGSIIHCRAAYDNSTANLANPDPTATVSWGDQSWNEMMLGYFDILLPRDDDRRAGSKVVQTGLDLIGTFDQANADGDNGLSAKEAAGNRLLAANFAGIDRDGDELLQLGEILSAARRLGRR